MPDRHEFHRVEICGRILTGNVHADGPYLKLLESRTFGHGAPLGQGLLLSREPGWRHYAVCRHGMPVMTLPLFSDDDVELVAREFGIPIAGRLKHFSFASSPAWQALKQWASKHPELAHTCERIRSSISDGHEAEFRRLAYR